MGAALSSYPQSASERDHWILAQRTARTALNPLEPFAFFAERELSAEGNVENVATVFLTNRECPFRCVMCDLWRNTLQESVPPGAIPRQIEFALEHLPGASIIKLYNSGSFFDPRAIPVADHPAIAALVRSFDRVIVECHPAFVGQHCLEFCNLLAGRLEVAMGLETAHPTVLEKLNKRMTLEQFSAAAEFLRAANVDLRVFILVQPPFLPPAEALHWAQRSLDFAFDCGATATTLIPTRGGNGAMEALAAENSFAPPSLSTLQAALEYGIKLHRGRVFADLWDLKPRTEPPCCFSARVERLHEMNLRQQIISPVHCDICGAQS